MEFHADDYKGSPLVFRQGQPFVEWPRASWTVIEPLSFLHGRKWDDIALGWVHALRPSHVRVTTGSVQLDAQEWRVTVFVNDEGVIDSIEQEVRVGLPEGVPHGHGLQVLTKTHNAEVSGATRGD